MPFESADQQSLLMWARLASSDGGLDPVDGAVRAAAEWHLMALSNLQGEYASIRSTDAILA